MHKNRCVNQEIMKNKCIAYVLISVLVMLLAPELCVKAAEVTWKKVMNDKSVVSRIYFMDSEKNIDVGFYEPQGNTKKVVIFNHKTGALIKSTEYSGIRSYSYNEDYFVSKVVNGVEYLGTMDLYGNEVIPAEWPTLYQYYSQYDSQLYEGRKEGKRYLLNQKGGIICEIAKDSEVKSFEQCVVTYDKDAISELPTNIKVFGYDGKVLSDIPALDKINAFEFDKSSWIPAKYEEGMSKLKLKIPENIVIDRAYSECEAYGQFCQVTSMIYTDKDSDEDDYYFENSIWYDLNGVEITDSKNMSFVKNRKYGIKPEYVSYSEGSLNYLRDVNTGKKVAGFSTDLLIVEQINDKFIGQTSDEKRFYLLDLSGKKLVSEEYCSGWKYIKESNAYIINSGDSKDKLYMGNDFTKPKIEADRIICQDGNYIAITSPKTSKDLVSVSIYNEKCTQVLTAKFPSNDRMWGEYEDLGDYISNEYSPNYSVSEIRILTNGSGVYVNDYNRQVILDLSGKAIFSGSSTLERPYIVYEKGNVNTIWCMSGVDDLKAVGATKPIVTPTPSIIVKKVENVTVGKVTNKSIKLTWDKGSNITGYQIEYASNKKFTKGRKALLVKTNAGIIKGLKKNTNYYMHIRAYKVNAGKPQYGEYSVIKKVKTKKIVE